MMQIFRSEKFEKTELETAIPSYNKAPLHRERMWKILFKMYECDAEKMSKSVKNNPWASLCQKIVLDVFPSFNIPKKRGPSKKRTDDRCIFVYRCYEGLKGLSNLKQAEIYHRLAKYQSEKTNNTVTESDVANDVNRGRKIEKENYKTSDDLGKIFTGGTTPKELYTSQDVAEFLHIQLNITPKNFDLNDIYDERNMGFYKKS